MADASDYAYSGVELGVEGAWKLALPGGEATAALTLGHNRYGGAEMSDYGRLDLGLSRTWARRYSGKVTVSAERQRRLDDPARSASVFTLAVGGVRRLANGDALSFQIEGRSTASAEETIDHSALGAEIGWQRARPVFGTSLSLSLGIEARDYPISAISTSGRQDTAVQGALRLAFDRWDYMGFIPTLSIEAESTSSNIALNRSHSVGLGLGVVSKF
jgi:hypothetical protein